MSGDKCPVGKCPGGICPGVSVRGVHVRFFFCPVTVKYNTIIVQPLI